MEKAFLLFRAFPVYVFEPSITWFAWLCLREGSLKKRMGGGPSPKFLPFFANCILINKKSQFLQKCQCFDLWTVLWVVLRKPHFKVTLDTFHLISIRQCLSALKKGDQLAQICGGGVVWAMPERKHSFFRWTFPDTSNWYGVQKVPLHFQSHLHRCERLQMHLPTSFAR